MGENYVFLPQEELASEEAPDSEGYLFQRSLNRMMSEIGDPDADVE